MHFAEGLAAGAVLAGVAVLLWHGHIIDEIHQGVSAVAGQVSKQEIRLEAGAATAWAKAKERLGL